MKKQKCNSKPYTQNMGQEDVEEESTRFKKQSPFQNMPIQQHSPKISKVGTQVFTLAVVV